MNLIAGREGGFHSPRKRRLMNDIAQELPMPRLVPLRCPIFERIKLIDALRGVALSSSCS